jgi:hypothetical protein
MQQFVLLIMTSAFILVDGAMGANAQQPAGPMQQQPQGIQQPQELQREQGRAQSPRRRVEEGRDQDDDDRYGGRRMGGGWGYHQDWRQRGAMGPGMMGSGNAGPSPSMMMRMIFTLMDSDGDGTVSLQEFQTAHERIFKGMDANKDSRLTLEEMLAFIQGTRR